jgi:arsenical pump membrane protein
VTLSHGLTWLVVVLATAGVIIRPWRLPEAVWAVSGAAILVIANLLPWRDALQAVGRGTDVYLFLTGMMLLSEVARREGLFDWLAAFAVRRSGGSARRLFLLIYGVGTVVTAFLSNDATAVVMTPAVFAAASRARTDPLPYLFVCAFIANAASFLLPISNPANLVLYGNHMPPLGLWLAHFLLPSVLSIGATLGALLVIERRHLSGTVDSDVEQPDLSRGGLAAAIGIGVTAVVLLAASAADVQLGLPTAVAGTATAAFVLWRKREAPWEMLRGVSWLVLPLVAGLFVLVAGLSHTGALTLLANWLQTQAQHAARMTAWGAGIVIALVCNITNNLPAGLIASSTVTAGHLPRPVTDALLVGVDLGPNLSITGSLATILWLTAIRREGEDVTFATFMARGAIVMPPAVLLALAGLLLR